jgi:hypothetical protein
MDSGAWGGRVWDDEAVELVHLVEAHLLPTLQQLDDLYNGMTKKFSSDFQHSHQTLFAVATLVGNLSVVVILSYIWVVNSCYNVLLVLMRRVLPAQILASEELQAYPLNRSKSNKRENLTDDA